MISDWLQWNWGGTCCPIRLSGTGYRHYGSISSIGDGQLVSDWLLENCGARTLNLDTGTMAQLVTVDLKTRSTVGLCTVQCQYCICRNYRTTDYRTGTCSIHKAFSTVNNLSVPHLTLSRCFLFLLYLMSCMYSIQLLTVALRTGTVAQIVYF